GIDFERFRREPRGEVAVKLGDHHRDLGGIEVEPDSGPDESSQERLHDIDAGRPDLPSAPPRLEGIPDEIDPRLGPAADAEAEPDARREVFLGHGERQADSQAQPDDGAPEVEDWAGVAAADPAEERLAAVERLDDRLDQWEGERPEQRGREERLGGGDPSESWHVPECPQDWEQAHR